ncbi:hypothetical protein HMI56_003392 [Coelomomyces lativittatus]|nr:hypothetical protein HMI56_003392 [Coelomomyces lativittatus]
MVQTRSSSFTSSCSHSPHSSLSSASPMETASFREDVGVDTFEDAGEVTSGNNESFKNNTNIENNFVDSGQVGQQKQSPLEERFKQTSLVSANYFQAVQTFNGERNGTRITDFT